MFPRLSWESPPTPLETVVIPAESRGNGGSPKATYEIQGQSPRFPQVSGVNVPGLAWKPPKPIQTPTVEPINCNGNLRVKDEVPRKPGLNHVSLRFTKGFPLEPGIKEGFPREQAETESKPSQMKSWKSHKDPWKSHCSQAEALPCTMELIRQPAFKEIIPLRIRGDPGNPTVKREPI